jgi:predicted dehydrogenase
MIFRSGRRAFLKQGLLVAGGAVAGGACRTASTAFGAPAILADRAPNSKLGVAVVGCGGAGGGNPKKGAEERLVALVDIDETTLGKARESAGDAGRNCRTFFDYRRMFDACEKDLDVVLIATPDHHHAPCAMRAIVRGKAFFVQKPLAHDIAECHALAEAVARHGVLGQMGNQGHYSDGIRRVVEAVRAGVIGPVRETHTVFGRNFGGAQVRPPAGMPAPATVHWDEWLGPAPARDYHGGLHPFAWRSWRLFGTGTIGDMACHNLDAVHWALRLSEVPSFTVECLSQTSGSEEQFTKDNVIRWSVPARGDQPPVLVHGYDHAELRPAVMRDLEEKHGLKPGEGSLFVGDKGFLYVKGNGSGGFVAIPEKLRIDAGEIPQSLPRAHGGPVSDLFHCLKHGGTPTSEIVSSAAPLTSFALTGHLAMFAGAGRPVEWDVAKRRSPNRPEVDRFAGREYRKGWEI